MNQETQYLFFEEQPQKGKTKLFRVCNKINRETLGYIKWFGAFRKYAYLSNGGIFYDSECLNDIKKFLEKLMLERKLESQNKNQSSK